MAEQLPPGRSRYRSMFRSSLASSTVAVNLLDEEMRNQMSMTAVRRAGSCIQNMGKAGFSDEECRVTTAALFLNAPHEPAWTVFARGQESIPRERMAHALVLLCVASDAADELLSGAEVESLVEPTFNLKTTTTGF